MIRRRVIYAIYSVTKTLACWAVNPIQKEKVIHTYEFSGYIKPPISLNHHTHTHIQWNSDYQKWVLVFDIQGFIFFLQDSPDDLTGYQFWSTHLMKVAAATAFGAGNFLLLSFDYSFVLSFNVLYNGYVLFFNQSLRLRFELEVEVWIWVRGNS